MVSGITKVFVYAVSAILIVLGLLFIISYNLGASYFLIGLVMLVVAGGLLYLSRGQQTVEIKQTLNLSGTPTVKEVKCPNCGALVDPTKPQIVAGRPYVTCAYCGNKFELTEEPKW
jgi:DNA-directed RNA polymerase subunit RPC12/RpoP